MTASNCGTAIVTGGSEGLGFALAHELALRGFAPWLIARRADRLKGAVQQLRANGIHASAIPADVADPSSMELAAATVREQAGQISLLVVCAGTVHPGTVASSSVAALDADIDVNLRGAILTTKFFCPLIERGGTILFISSGFGLMGPAGYASYAAAKAGVIAFAEALKRELHFRRIAVYAAVPSDIETPGFQRERNSLPPWLRVAGTRGKPLAADVAARRILDGCRPGRFLIFSDTGVWGMSICKAVLPSRLVSWGIDRLFPRPPDGTC